MRSLAIFAATLAITSCAVGPDYERPEVDAPEDFRERIDEGASLANAKWWDIFKDEELDRLIKVALEESKDLVIASARLEEARARYGFTKADLYPQIGIVGQAQRTDQFQQIIPDAGIQNNFFVGADLSWEIDLFGRLRRSNEAARADYLAAEETINKQKILKN